MRSLEPIKRKPDCRCHESHTKPTENRTKLIARNEKALSLPPQLRPKRADPESRCLMLKTKRQTYFLIVHQNGQVSPH